MIDTWSRHSALAYFLSMIFSDLPSPAEASNAEQTIIIASRRRETGIYFWGSCSEAGGQKPDITKIRKAYQRRRPLAFSSYRPVLLLANGVYSRSKHDNLDARYARTQHYGLVAIAQKSFDLSTICA